MKMSSTEEMAKKFATEKRAFFKGLVPIIISVVVAILLAAFTGIVGGIIGIIIVPIIAFLVLYFVWAPNDVFGTFPEEGYATVIVRGLGFRKLFLKKKGFGFNDNWDVVPVEYATIRPREFLGMFLFLWPFERLYVYKQKWVKYTEKEKPVEKEEVLRGALLKSYVYFVGLTNAEDSRQMPINVGIAVEMAIVNPYKALFQMQNWYGGITNFIQGEIRDEIRQRSYVEMIASGQTSLDIIFEKKLRDLVDKIKEQYGVEILKVKTVEISPANKELIDASTRAAVAELKLKATKTDAEAQAIRRAAETAGTEMGILSKTIGIPEDKIQEEIQKNPEEFEKKYKNIIENARDKVNRQMAIDGKQFMDIRTPGDQSGLMALVALAKTLTERDYSKGQKEEETMIKEKKETTEEKKKKLGFRH